MKPTELLEIMHITQRLKNVPRHCVLENGRVESVAEHCWQVSLMAMLLENEFKDADMNKVIKMCLIHDLGEAFTGDIPAFNKTESDTEIEDDLYLQWVNGFPEKEKEDWLSLLIEMNEQISIESKVYKALDKLEAVIQHDESDISTWLPLEYDLQLTYGTEQVQFSDYLKALKAEIDKITINKINESV